MIDKAMEHYNFCNPAATFLRHNENMTYKISDSGKSYVLRIHKPAEGINFDFLRMGNDPVAQVASEAELLQYLENTGNMETQKVIPNKHGQAVTQLDDGLLVTVLEWIGGTTLEGTKISEEIAKEIGIMLGRLHTNVAGLAIKNRYRYDCALLKKMIAEADNAQLKGHFTKKHSAVMKSTLQHIHDYLSNAERDFILVHSDLAMSNLIWNQSRVIPIDFSLSGYCIPEMDLASVFSHINNNALHPHILDGYQSACGLIPCDKGVAVCFSLGILLFLTAQHNKIAGESWLDAKMDGWCENYFLPLTNT